MVYFISALAVALLAILFALQNTEPVAVKFLFWRIQGSLAISLFAAFGLGVLTTVLMMLPSAVRQRLGSRAAARKVPDTTGVEAGSKKENPK